jgi:hypothetical protein
MSVELLQILVDRLICSIVGKLQIFIQVFEDDLQEMFLFRYVIQVDDAGGPEQLRREDRLHCVHRCVVIDDGGHVWFVGHDRNCMRICGAIATLLFRSCPTTRQPPGIGTGNAHCARMDSGFTTNRQCAHLPPIWNDSRLGFTHHDFMRAGGIPILLAGQKGRANAPCT